MSPTSWLYRFVSRSINHANANAKTSQSSTSQSNPSYSYASNSNESIGPVPEFNHSRGNPSKITDQESSSFPLISMQQSLLDYEKQIGQTASVILKETLPHLFESCRRLINEVGGDLSTVSEESIYTLKPRVITTRHWMSNESSDLVEKNENNWDYLSDTDQGQCKTYSEQEQADSKIRYYTMPARPMNKLSNLCPADRSKINCKRKRDQDIGDPHPYQECFAQSAMDRSTSCNVPINCLKRPRGYSSTANPDFKTIPRREGIPTVYDSNIGQRSCAKDIGATKLDDPPEPISIHVANSSIEPKRLPAQDSRISGWNKAVCGFIYCILECSIQTKLLLQQYTTRDKFRELGVPESKERSDGHPNPSQLHPSTRSKMKLELETLMVGGSNILNAIEKYHSTRFDILFKIEKRQREVGKENEDSTTVHSKDSSVTAGIGGDSEGDEPDELTDSCLRELDTLLEILDERQQIQIWLWTKEIQTSCVGIYRLLKLII